MNRQDRERRNTEIVEAYQAFTSMIELAETYGITRQGIYKILKAYGIDTTKGKVEIECSQCGAIIKRNKARLRRTNNNFCDQPCYLDWINEDKPPEIDTEVTKRQYQRRARKIVAEHFDLLPGYVVHHEDRDQSNNDLSNLAVFACNADHVAYHRGADIKPLWQGKNTEILLAER